MQLTLTLSQQHKTFAAGFSCVLEGSIVVVSGVNGSGKSQLLEVLQGHYFLQPQNKIMRRVTLDGLEIDVPNVLTRTYKENINIPEITQASPQNLANVRSQVHNAYNMERLSGDGPNFQGFSQSSRKARAILIHAFGLEAFNSGTLSLSQIGRALPLEFAWTPNDSFSNEVGEIFFAYCLRKNDLEAAAGREGRKPVYDGLGPEPWRELNSLFSELRLDYRFQTDFSLVGIEINEQPTIYHVDDQGNADVSRPRGLSELSDGEKAIISLCFASLRQPTGDETKVLLLDEFDATLNPSLIEAFYVVLQRFFVEKNVLPIIVTHSIATISLAPAEASFYEVYRPSDVADRRLLPVQRHNYVDLEKVGRGYYAEIADQPARIEKIESEFLELQTQKARLEQEVHNLTRPLILTEGHTDVTHLRVAADSLELTLDLDFFDQTDVKNRLGSSRLDKYLQNLAMSTNSKKIIGIFDRDEPGYVNKIGDLYSYGNNVYAFCIPAPSFRQNSTALCLELLYRDEVLKRTRDGKHLFFTNEIARLARSSSVKMPPIIVEPPPGSEASKSIFDEDVSTIVKDGRQVAHSKSTFARLIAGIPEFREGIDFSPFSPIFDKIFEILTYANV